MSTTLTPASSKRALVQLLLLPAVALGILTCVLALQIRSLESSAAWVDHTDLVIAQINDLMRLMIDEETGVRGYLLTGRKEFLDPYTRAKDQTAVRFQQLQGLVKTKPVQAERLRKLSLQNDAWEKFAAWRLRTPRTHQQVIDDSLSAKAGIDKERSEAAQLINTEDELREQRSAAALFRSHMTYLVLPLLSGLAAAIIFLFTRKIFRNIATIHAEHLWLNSTLRGIGDAVIACDPAGNVVFMNGVAETLTGWTESESRGHALPEIFHIVNEDSRALVESPVEKALRLGRGVGLANDTLLVGKDGSEVAIDDSANPVQDAQGSLIGVVLVFRDVSERREMERALRKSEAKSQARTAELEAIMQVVPALIFIAQDAGCQRVNSNLLTYEVLRLPVGGNTSQSAAREDGQQSFRMMKNGRELTAAELPLEEATATGREVTNVELTIAFDDGSSREIFGNARPLFDESGAVRGAVAAFIDITERKHAEDILRKTEKLAFAGRMAASMAHEINNPLESVTNLLYLLKGASSLEQVREYTQVAQEELERVTTIVTHTLRFNRQSSLPTVVSLPVLLDSVLTLYGRRLSSSNITVERRYDATASLYAYDGELRQVFLNLIGNAFDATRNVGKKLIVRERQAIDFRTGYRGIRVTVADSGHGMDRTTLKRLFEPFFSTKGDTGTGLGLWVSKGIIDKHYGTMRVRSSQRPHSRGTVFSIFFPFEAIRMNEQLSLTAMSS